MDIVKESSAYAERVISEAASAAKRHGTEDNAHFLMGYYRSELKYAYIQGAMESIKRGMQ
tara:strand:+ start:194 stop:373 length:180 start_codon:yes stop_codon:yes gene_type:complete